MEAQNPQQVRQKIQGIAYLIWIALPGFDLLVKHARHEIDPDADFMINLKHHGPTNIRPLLDILGKPDTSPEFQVIRSNLIVMLVRATVADAFETVHVYCKAKGPRHREYLYGKEWFYFARAIRNTFSHDGKLKYLNEGEKKDILRSEWRGKKIHESMFDHPIDVSFFSFDDALLFIDDLSHFCDELEEFEKTGK